MADVAGKGLAAALLMANMQAVLKSTASEYIQPASLCAGLNDFMCGNTPENKFITCFYGLLDVPRRRLTFSNAGHNPPLLVRSNGACVRLENGGTVIGAFTDTNYTQAEVQLYSGDRLLMFTDGLTEATNEAGEEFGEERLRDLLVERRRSSAAELQECILNTVKAFCDSEFDDDAALLVLEVE
jgi:sigma-B regulation protein RsbU (phosphoserine phosphatase)